MNSTNLQNFEEFDSHKFFSEINDPQTGLTAYIAIHRGGIEKPAFGATRVWHYQNQHDAITDALKLSHMMSYKSAMAGLPYGGAKAVIIKQNTSNSFQDQLISYAKRLNYINSSFITGADVGMSPDDVKLMAKYAKNIVGVSCDPVLFTVEGVYLSLQVSLNEIFGNKNLKDRTFAIQGLGKTGYGLFKKLVNEAKHIYITDLNSKLVNDLKKNYKNITSVSTSEIYDQKVDVFMPCALSNTINSKTVSKLKCQIICGSANCQLENKETGELLYKLSILYAPDYVINAGGLMAVVDEYENGKSNSERVIKQVAKIPKTLKEIFNNAKKLNKPTNLVSDEIAQKISDQRI